MFLCVHFSWSVFVQLDSTLPRWKQSRGERHATSSTGSGTPRVSTQCWRHQAGLLWSNDARLVDCWCSTKSKVALHIAPPWKPNWSPSRHVNDATITNRSPCWPPEPSIEAPPSSPKPSGTGTHYPWKLWRPPPLTLLCQGYETEKLLISPRSCSTTRSAPSERFRY